MSYELFRKQVFYISRNAFFLVVNFLLTSQHGEGCLPHEIIHVITPSLITLQQQQFLSVKKIDKIHFTLSSTGHREEKELKQSRPY